MYLAIAGIFGAAFIWEHVARINNSNFKPSRFINSLADCAADTFELIGRLFARLSSFYEYIRLHEVFLTLCDLLRPTLVLMVTPFGIIYGYVTALDVYKHPGLILAGSATLMAGTVAGVMKHYALPWEILQFWNYASRNQLIACAVTPFVGGMCYAVYVHRSKVTSWFGKIRTRAEASNRPAFTVGQSSTAEESQGDESRLAPCMRSRKR